MYPYKNEMKQRIENLLENSEYEQAWEVLQKYEKLCPKDPEIETYRFMYAIGLEKYDFAFICAQNAVKKMPYSADAHYNYARICQLLEKWCEAYEQYGVALQLAKCGIEYHFDEKEIENSIDYVIEKISEVADETDILELQKKKKCIDYLMFKETEEWGIPYSVFQHEDEIIGTEYMDYKFLAKLFLAIGSEEDEWKWRLIKPKKNTMEEKTELQRVSEKKNVMVIEQERESFLPIVAETEDMFLFKNNEQKITVLYTEPMQFVNYRIPVGKTLIEANNPFRVGEAVPIEHSKHRKKLVLNIFVDGLSQTVLRDGGMELYMPYTYKFFKKGMICTNAHTTGDWTYPSIASVVTGQTISKHKMLHSGILRKLDEDTPILYEYFKEKGYNTTKIGGNWRITPNYGYARGMNRVFYQHMYTGYSIEKVVSDVQEQIHQMRETDQFIWMEIGELHTIADEANLKTHMSEFSVFENQLSLGKVNSVKQDYNEMKIKYYLKRIGRVDRKLASLYQYIEDNYSEDEILISLFSDHGQSYLIKPEEEFLSERRSNVAFMFRGNGIQGYTDEVMSICDYTPIMCQMAGIPYEYKNTDAHLPKVFGGTEERKFALTETIHVGDPYQVSLKGKDFTFYLNGIENVTQDCRVPLEKFSIKLLDGNGNEIFDEARREYYKNYCLEHIGSCLVYK